MSKSLKNFITVQEALAMYTARQLRLAFLGQLWSSPMDFKQSTMLEVKARETAIDVSQNTSLSRNNIKIYVFAELLQCHKSPYP